MFDPIVSFQWPKRLNWIITWIIASMILNIDQVAFLLMCWLQRLLWQVYNCLEFCFPNCCAHWLLHTLNEIHSIFLLFIYVAFFWIFPEASPQSREVCQTQWVSQREDREDLSARSETCILASCIGILPLLFIVGGNPAKEGHVHCISVCWCYEALHSCVFACLQKPLVWAVVSPLP